MEAQIELLEAGEMFSTGLPAIATPLDALISLYRQQKADIERISKHVQEETEAINYFVTGARQTHGRESIGIDISLLFDAEAAIRALDSSFWGRALHLTDVLEYMPAKRRTEWTKMVANGFVEKEVMREDKFSYRYKNVERESIPHFEEETVYSTIKGMLAQREQFFAERVDGLWNSLSRVHLTNQVQGFSKRMILNRVINYHQMIDHDMGEYIHDLRCIIAKFMGRDAPTRQVTFGSLAEIARDVEKGVGAGKWYSFDGGAWKIRCYKIGTAHMEIHPEMAWRLNAVLASLYPMAIPSEFRKKPVKVQKQFALVNDLVPFEVLEELRSCRFGRDGFSASFISKDQPLSDRGKRLLEFLGGVQEDRWTWKFDYNPMETFSHLQMTGQIPAVKSYQYYPTQKSLAEEAVAWADILPHHTKLEPSAGQGGIADVLGVENTLCVEISPLHCKILEAKKFKTVCADFLTWACSERVDRIVMNPPFSEGRAEAHVRRAVSCLKDEGVLVAILPASFRGKNFIDGWAHEYSSVRSGEFKGVGVSVVLLKLTRE